MLLASLQSMAPRRAARPVRVDALDYEIQSKDQEGGKDIIMLDHDPPPLLTLPRRSLTLGESAYAACATRAPAPEDAASDDG